MDRAREIQKVIAQVKYKIGSPTTYYAVLIEHEGDCSRTAMTACSLAKALGLKSSVAGTNHGSYGLLHSSQWESIFWAGRQLELEHSNARQCIFSVINFKLIGSKPGFAEV